MKYIGISGRRGSGRQTIAWLLGRTLQEQHKKTSYEDYQKLFKQWTDQVKDTKDWIRSNNFFLLESFGGIILDSIKLTIPSLSDLDLTQDSPDLKLPFDVSTLTVGDTENSIEIKDFIIQYADKMIKGHFGANFWTNIAEQWAKRKEEDEYTTEKYIIYWDVKTDAEVEYIRRHEGKIIDITCPERLRKGGYNTIKTTEPDMCVRLHPDFVGDCQTIWELAQSL